MANSAPGGEMGAGIANIMKGRAAGGGPLPAATPMRAGQIGNDTTHAAANPEAAARNPNSVFNRPQGMSPMQWMAQRQGGEQ